MSAHAVPPFFDWLYAAAHGGSVRRAWPDDAVDGTQPEYVVAPGTEDDLARVLSGATSYGLRTTACGGGSKRTWGVPPSSLELVISTARLDRVLEHANHDMTVTVESGVTIDALQRVLAQRGQRLALDPLWPERATVGGVIATNDSGSLRLRFGGVRDLIIGATIVLADGTVAKSGGKVVKNVAGYDLPKLMTGSFGTLGIITKAVFRLHPLPEHSRTVTVRFENPLEANRFMLAVADSTLVPTGIQMRTGAERESAVDLRFEGVEAGITAQLEKLRPLALGRPVTDADPEAWRAREELFVRAAGAVTSRLAVLPAEIGATVEFIRSRFSALQWDAVIQSTGLGQLRVEFGDLAQAEELVSTLRRHVKSGFGTLVLLHASPEWKREIGVWGESGSAQPLMKRIKEAFDPKGTLNRGRFVGGL